MHHTASALLNRLLARGKFRHVQVVLQLTELGSVQKTADAIGMTQSAVTQSLAAVEELLEVRLFDRHSRGMRPTAACKDLLPVMRQLMEGLAEGADIVVARNHKGQSSVRMIASVAAINGLLLDALALFSRREPAIQVTIREAEGEDQLLAISRGEVDVVVCRRPAVIPAGWEFRVAREDRLVVVCSAHHPLAGRGASTMAELAEATWLLLPAGLAARRHFDELSEQFAGAPRTYAVVTRSLPIMWSSLSEENLLAILPLTLVQPLLARGELVDLAVPGMATMDPIGVLQPVSGMRDAAAKLSAFLQKFASLP